MEPLLTSSEIQNLIRTIWPIIYVAGAVAFGLVIWGIRLEMKVYYLEKDHDKSVKATDAKHDTLWMKLDAVITSIGNLNVGIGRLEEKVDSLRKDR